MMTPEQKRLLADALMDSAIQTADEAARLGLRDIPEGALNAACGLSNKPHHNRTQETIRQIVQDRIAIRMEELSNPPKNTSEAREYAKRETDLYANLVSNIFALDGLKPSPQQANIALSRYHRILTNELKALGEAVGDIDISPSTDVEVPTFSEICSANKAGRAI